MKVIDTAWLCTGKKHSRLELTAQFAVGANGRRLWVAHEQNNRLNQTPPCLRDKVDRPHHREELRKLPASQIDYLRGRIVGQQSVKELHFTSQGSLILWQKKTAPCRRGVVNSGDVLSISRNYN